MRATVLGAPFVETNRRIGMAIGIRMASLRLTDEAAVECLRWAGDQRDVTLRAVAEEVVYDGAPD